MFDFLQFLVQKGEFCPPGHFLVGYYVQGGFCPTPPPPPQMSEHMYRYSVLRSPRY